MKTYQRCTRCVMDNTADDLIEFDESGRCNYCCDALHNMENIYFPSERGRKKLDALILRLKEVGKGKKYDCLMGISGGLDSSYLAYLGAKKWGLRILAVHIDDGFDTEVAKANIRNLCTACDIELITEKPDAEQYNDLIRSFILAEVPNVAIPQDNILFACLYRYARKYKVYNFLSGGNFALESIFQTNNTYGSYDMVHNRAIHKQFGTKPINKLHFISNFRRDWDRVVLHIHTLRPLNYIDYNKNRAIKELFDFCHYEYYEAKHLENTLTKVIQVYWFARKFKVDKRKWHFSSLIVSGQMTRGEALIELEKPLYNEVKMNEDLDFILDRLNLSREEFECIIEREGKQHTEYKTGKLYLLIRKLMKKCNNKIG